MDNEEDVKLIEGRAGLERADIRVQMEPTRWGNWVHSHIRFLVDELRGRDTSWTKDDPQWGHQFSIDPEVVFVCCICRVPFSFAFF